MLNQITPQTALYYSFHTTSSAPPTATYSASSLVLGPAEALRELLHRGCALATQPWVENHWSLILWKLAGMVAFDPSKEENPNEKRWCWAEVVRQLLYRSVSPPILPSPFYSLFRVCIQLLTNLTTTTYLQTDTNAS